MSSTLDFFLRIARGLDLVQCSCPIPCSISARRSRGGLNAHKIAPSRCLYWCGNQRLIRRSGMQTLARGSHDITHAFLASRLFGSWPVPPDCPRETIRSSCFHHRGGGRGVGGALVNGARARWPDFHHRAHRKGARGRRRPPAGAALGRSVRVTRGEPQPDDDRILRLLPKARQR